MSGLFGDPEWKLDDTTWYRAAFPTVMDGLVYRWRPIPEARGVEVSASRNGICVNGFQGRRADVLIGLLDAASSAARALSEGRDPYVEAS